MSPRLDNNFLTGIPNIYLKVDCGTPERDFVRDDILSSNNHTNDNGGLVKSKDVCLLGFLISLTLLVYAHPLQFANIKKNNSQ